MDGQAIAPDDAQRFQTLERLSQMQKNLQDITQFSASVNELLTWCSDNRAYVPAYEEKLVACLAVIRDMAFHHSMKIDLTLGMCWTQ